MTLFLAGVFLLIAAFTIGYLWRHYRHLLAARPRVEVFDPDDCLREWLEREVRR